jgi:hypothetical protein
MSLEQTIEHLQMKTQNEHKIFSMIVGLKEFFMSIENMEGFVNKESTHNEDNQVVKRAKTCDNTMVLFPKIRFYSKEFLTLGDTFSHEKGDYFVMSDDMKQAIVTLLTLNPLSIDDFLRGRQKEIDKLKSTILKLQTELAEI